MKRSTFMTEVATWVATNACAEARKSFTQWESHWGHCFAQPVRHHYFTRYAGCLEHWDWQRGCQSCGEIPRHHIRDEASTISLFQQMAHELGHYWAVQWTGSTPVNFTELVYLNHTTALFGDWGYNPPLTYRTLSPVWAPWAVEEIFHRTARQSFTLRAGHVELDLTTTTDDVRIARTIWTPTTPTDTDTDTPKVTIIVGDKSLQRRYRYTWLNTYISTVGADIRVIEDTEGNGVSKNYSEWLATIPE